MSISYRSNRDPAQPGGNAFFVSAANLLHLQNMHFPPAVPDLYFHPKTDFESL